MLAQNLILAFILHHTAFDALNCLPVLQKTELHFKFCCSKIEMANSESFSQEACLTQEQNLTQPINDPEVATSEDVQRPSSWGCLNGVNLNLPIGIYICIFLLIIIHITCNFTEDNVYYLILFCFDGE
jgi:hypothetical protein